MIPAARPLIGQPRNATPSTACMQSGMLAQGPEVAAFERGVRRTSSPGCACVAVNSGTSALHLALLSLGGIGPRRRGHRPLVLASRRPPTSSHLTGATAVFADIEPDHLRPGPGSGRGGDHARAPRPIMPVHLYGHPAAMDQIPRPRPEATDCSWSTRTPRRRSAAELRRHPGRRVGRSPRAFSFYPTKNMTTGEGGMVTTSPTRTLASRRMARLLPQPGHGEAGTRTRSSASTTRMTDHACRHRSSAADADWPEWTAKPGRRTRPS